MLIITLAAVAPSMLMVTLVAVALVAVTVALHAGGLAMVLWFLLRWHATLPVRPWPIVMLLVRVTWMLIGVHLAQVAVWALFYIWLGLFPDAETAFYFSGSTYTTLGYGDVVLPAPWRMLGPAEGLTGLLMCGLSAGLFIAIVTRIYARHFHEGLDEAREQQSD